MTVNQVFFRGGDVPLSDANSTQTVPVRVYQTADKIMLAAPMPGLKPENIAVRVDGDHVTIRSAQRGPRQAERNLLVVEWAIGPYHREITLPLPVSGALTNATYGNGVLVLSMPKLQAGQRNEPAEFPLQAAPPPPGERVGHTGRAIRKTTTQEHRRKKAQTIRTAGRNR
jgi:HSP20 family protein